MRRELEYRVESPEQIRRACAWMQQMTEKGLQTGAVVVRLGRERRTKDQNSKLWPMLTDLSRQVEWVVDGERRYMKPEEWKDLMTAALRKQSMAPGIDGGMVVLGLHTSTMPKQRFSELIELIYAFGSDRGVKWSEPAKKTMHQFREVA